MALRDRFERATNIEGDKESRRQIASLRDRRRGYIRTQQGPQVNVEGPAKGVTGKAKEIVADRRREQEKDLSEEEKLLDARIYNQFSRHKNECIESLIQVKGKHAPKAATKCVEDFKEKNKKSLEGVDEKDLKRNLAMMESMEEDVNTTVTRWANKELLQVKKQEMTENMQHALSEVVQHSGDDNDLKAKMDFFINTVGDNASSIMGLTGDALERHKQAAKSRAVLEAMGYQVNAGTGRGYKRARQLFKNFKKGMMGDDIKKANDLLRAADVYELDDKSFMLFDKITKIHKDNESAAKEMLKKLVKKEDNKGKLYSMTLGKLNDFLRSYDSQKRENRDNTVTQAAEIFEKAVKADDLGPETLQVALNLAKRRKLEMGDYNKIRSYYERLKKGEIDKIKSNPSVYAMYDQMFFNDPRGFAKINFASEMILKPDALSPAHYRMFQARKEWAAKREFDAPPSALLKPLYDKISKVKEPEIARQLVNYVNNAEKEGTLGDPKTDRMLHKMLDQYSDDKGWWFGIGKESPEQMEKNRRMVEYSEYHPKFKEVFESGSETDKMILRSAIDKLINRHGRLSPPMIESLYRTLYGPKKQPPTIGP